MGEKLLFIDDDAEVLDINKKYFESEGFEVSTAATVMEGSGLLTAFRPDLIVLDVMMPGIDGFEACTLFRKRTNAPILFLSGKVEEADKIKGFESGADDYLEKPCSLPEMKARIMANIRRSRSYDSTTKKTFGSLSIDEISHKVLWQNEEIALSKREYQLLILLIERKEYLVTFEEIGKEMFGAYTPDDRRVVMVQVSRLRKKLDLYTKGVEIIETVWSKGYKFVVK